MMKSLVLILTVLSFAVSANAKIQSVSVQEGAYILDADKSILKTMAVNQDLVFDHVGKSGFEVYGPEGLLSFLKKHNIPHYDLNRKSRFPIADYPSPEQIEAMILDLNKQFPHLTQVIEIGKSVEGRKLLVLKISDTPWNDEAEPEFKYISSMHGDEITGRELMVQFAKDLLSSYGTDARSTSLINSTEIFIMASMNPDGSARRMRGNARYKDLNRNFPDFSTSDNKDDPNGREDETKAVMNFQKQRQIALSANFHGGAEVMNYAWDTIPDRHPFYDLLVFLSLEYANRVPYIKNSNEFPNGITNGFEWYEVNGGMQDWSYYWYNDLQFTVELSEMKWPSYSKIPYYYQENKAALFEFARLVHMGAGFTLDKSGVNGMVTLNKVVNGVSQKLGQYKFRNSEFYKVLQPGEYSFQIQGDGLEPITFNSVVINQTEEFNPNYTFLKIKN